MMNPAWAKNRVEIYEEPGYIDDNFRNGWSAIAMANEPTDKHFWTITWGAGGIAGDLAEMVVTESALSEGAGYRKDLSAKNLSTNTYPKFRARLKGADTQPYYKIKIVYTDDTSTDTGWISASADAFFIKTLDLTAAKTIKYVELYVKSNAGSGNTAKILWDYVAILKTQPFVPTDITFGGDPNQCLVKEIKVSLEVGVSVSSCEIKVHYDSSVIYPDVGAIVMVYIADSKETETELNQKIFRGRIKGLRQSKPDQISEVVYECADLMADFIDEYFTKEYATATNLADIVKDIATACMSYSSTKFFDVTTASVNNTSNTIKEIYKGVNALDLLKQLVGISQWAGPVYGGIVFLDVGGDLHFEKIGQWSAPVNITDSDIRKVIIVKREIEDIVNDFKLIIKEEEYFPGDENQWDETDEDLNSVPDGWSEDHQGVNVPTITLETTNIKSGAGAARINFAANPGTWVYFRRIEIPEVNWVQCDRFKFWFYRKDVTMDADGLDVRLITEESWLAGARFYQKDGLSIPADDAWQEFNLSKSDFTRQNNPGDRIVRLDFRFDSSLGLGIGHIIIDKIRMIRDEVYVTSSDSTSQGKYGVKKKEKTDKNFNYKATAQYWADNFVNSMKDPYTHVIIGVRGRAQVGFRPPQQLSLTISDIFDPISAESYQIIRANHILTPGVYEAELELHEAMKLPLPIPSVIEIIRTVSQALRRRDQENKSIRWIMPP